MEEKILEIIEMRSPYSNHKLLMCKEITAHIFEFSSGYMIIQMTQE